MTDTFTPPPNPQDGEGYTFGNVVWNYQASNGVWNISTGSLVGAQGTPGSPGDRGTTGPGFTGAKLNGDGTLTFQFEDWSAGSPAKSIVNIGYVGGRTGSGYTGATLSLTGAFSLTFADWSTGNLVETTVFLGNIMGPTGSTGPTGIPGPVGATSNQVVFADVGGASGNNNFRFNGLQATFGGANTRLTVTGPTMQIGFNTEVLDGVFKSPREFSGYRTVSGTSTLNISPAEGTIQRVLFTPPAGVVTINANSSGWSNVTGHSETIVAFIKTNSAAVTEGKFHESILVSSPRPTDICEHTVTGAVDMITLMRICTGVVGGVSRGLTMGFYVARGLTNNAVSDRSTNFET